MNKVIEGAYLGKGIKLATNKKTTISVYINLGGGKKIYLNSDTVSSYSVLDLERHKGLKQAGVGYVVAGGVGAMVGAVANSGGIKVKVKFKDGQVSLIEFNNQFYNYFLRGVYDIEQDKLENNNDNAKSSNNDNSNIKSNNIITQEKKPIPKGIIVLAIIFIIIIATVMNKQLNSGDNLIIKKMNVEREQATIINETFKNIGIEDFSSIEYSNEYDNLEGQGTKGYVVVYNKYYDEKEERNIKQHVIVYLDSSSNVIYITDGNTDYYKGNNVLNKVNVIK